MSNFYTNLHLIFNALPRFKPGQRVRNIPKNGLYIIFEKRGKGEEFDRIVRVIANTSDGKLPQLIKQHLHTPDRNKSILRNNIGLAILSKRRDSYIKQWSYDTSTKRSKELHVNELDPKKELHIENEITRYIQSNFTIAVIPINNREQRCYFEEKIATTIANQRPNPAPESWLGHHSPKAIIRDSGMWQVKSIWGEMLNDDDMEQIHLMVFQ